MLMSIHVSAQSKGHELVRILQLQFGERGMQRAVGRIRLWGLGPEGLI